MPTFHGPSADEQLATAPLTLPALLERSARDFGDREALVFREDDGRVVRWTYDDLLANARRVAKALIAHGVVKGTRVATIMPNRPELVAADFGIAMAGGVLIPLSTFTATPELDYVLRHSDTSVLLVQEQLLSHNYLDMLTEICPELLEAAAPGSFRTPRFPFLRTVAALGIDSPRGAVVPLDSFLSRADEITDELLDASIKQVTQADDGIVIYTSGSTAQPKGVLHAQRSPALQAWRQAELNAVDPTCRVWSAFPFFWTGGFTMCLGATLAGGACAVLQDHFDAADALALIEEERVTTVHAKAHQIAQFEDEPTWDKRDLSSLRQFMAFSSFSRHPSVKSTEVWGTSAYGLSETMSHCTGAPSDLAPEQRAGNYGWILPGNAIRIVDPKTGESLGANEQGEITVKGLTLAKGYVKTPVEDVFDGDGFFHTSDAGFVDDDGKLHFTGRASLMIKTGGANVSPLEIENELVQHPSIRMVWVIGVPDPKRDEIVVACIVPHEGSSLTEDDVRDFLRGKLASYKIPRRVCFVEEHELALTGNGAKPKIDDLRRLVDEHMAKSA